MKTYDILTEVKGRFVVIQGHSISHTMQNVLRDVISNISPTPVQVFEFKVSTFQDLQWFHHLNSYVNQALTQPVIIVVNFVNPKILYEIDCSGSTEAMYMYRTLHILQSTIQSTKNLYAFVLTPVHSMCLNELATTKIQFEHDECMVKNIV